MESQATAANNGLNDNITVLKELKERISQDLWGRTLPFWLKHSIDQKNGGFFNCLSCEGEVTETTKHVWLQGRQCYMFAKVANSYTDSQIESFANKYQTG